MLIQLHWQKWNQPEATVLVAQGDLRSNEELQEWVCDLLQRRGGECPDRWLPLICNEESPLFSKQRNG